MQVAFGANFFSFMYHTRDEERNPVERKLKIVVQNHLVAKSIFRTVTEEQVFFYQNTVSNMVLNHADDRHKKWKSFRQKVQRKRNSANHTIISHILHTFVCRYSKRSTPSNTIMTSNVQRTKPTNMPGRS